jgi:ATP phosphoribosyltransferase regulatory subunit
MIYQPPAGARDFLPLEVAQKEWVEQRLQDTFHRWSYHKIITPTLERLDTLLAGGAIQPETVIQLLGGTDEGLLGLRPELTAPIARAAVTRMAGVTYPQRLYYSTNIFRRAPQANVSRQQEFFQAGVELLGRAGSLADAEILLLLQDSLQRLGITDWHVILGDAGLTHSLLSMFPESLYEPLRQAIAQLDWVAIEALPLEPELRQRALTLMNLRGQPAQVLQQVAELQLDPPQHETLNNLKSLVDLLGPHYPLTLDLSLIQTFDYYTGIIFEVVGKRSSETVVLGQGGRYDQLLGVYHPSQQTIPGIGFVLNLEALHQFLLQMGKLPQQTPTSDWLVVPAHAQACSATFSYAQKLRWGSSEHHSEHHLVRVEVDLELRAVEATRDYARTRQIANIAWIGVDGTAKIEAVTG